MIRMIQRVQRKHIWLFLCAGCFIAAQVGLSLQIPTYMENITMLVKTEGSSLTDIWINGGWMLLCAALAILSAIGAGYFSVRAAAVYCKGLREDIYSKVEEFSMNEMDTFSTASLITRSTNDVTQIQNFMCKGLQHLVKAPIMVIWALIKITGRHWEWTALTGLAVVVMVLVVIFMMVYAHPRLRRRQQYTDDLSRVLRENLMGIRVIRAYNAEQYQEKKYDEANEILTVNERKAHHAMGLMRPTIKLVNNVLMVGIYLIGAVLIAQESGGNQIQLFSEMVVYSSYAAILIQAFMDMNMAFNQYPRAAVSAERILQVLDADTRVQDGSSPAPARRPGGTLEFDHVSFTYPGARNPAIKDISFKLPAGKTLAIIGATGSGKSTLLSLIPRLYDASQGTIRLDGLDIKNYPLNELHDRLGYASQKAILLSGTVRSNVLYGDNGSPREEESLVEALRIAQASSFVKEMDGGTEARIARGGTSVSGGQKQRLSMARTIAWKPELYLFDDSFSALDFETDRALRNALKKETAGVTTLLVAQRIGTIKDADEIIVLDNGEIVGSGTHTQLLQSCSVYQEIARTQLSEEELAYNG